MPISLFLIFKNKPSAFTTKCHGGCDFFFKRFLPVTQRRSMSCKDPNMNLRFNRLLLNLGDDLSFHFPFICDKELHWLSLRHKIFNLMSLNTKYSVVPKLMVTTADHCFNLKNWSLSYFSHLINKFCTSKLSSNCKDFASYLLSLGMAWGSFLSLFWVIFIIYKMLMASLPNNWRLAMTLMSSSKPSPSDSG